MRVIRFFAVILISVFLADCAQTKTVTVTEYRDRVVTDTLEKLRVDSVYVSRWIKQKGDTIILHDTIFKYRFNLTFYGLLININMYVKMRNNVH